MGDPTDDMSTTFWRWLVAALLIANMIGLVLYVRGDARPEPAQPAIPPLPAEWPQLILPHEVGSALLRELGECFSIGPLNSLLAQQRAEDRLRANASQVRSRQTISERDRGWWVYLPAGTRNEALDLTRTLTEAGLEDFFVVTRGEMENVVSVGLFEDVANARERLRRVREAGFNAQMEIRREATPQFWVDYEAEPGASVPWQFILEASPGAQHRPIPCFDPATGVI